MVTVIAGLVAVAALLLTLAGLAVYLFQLRLPERAITILWAIPFGPIVMLAAVLIFFVAYPRGW